MLPSAIQECGCVRTTGNVETWLRKCPKREYLQIRPQEAAGAICRVSGRGLPPASKLDPVLMEHNPL